MMQKTYLDADRVRHKNRGQKDRYYLADNHIPIVDSDDWNAVQEILDDRSIALKEKVMPKAEGMGDSHSTYPLTGMLYCPKCGGMLHHKFGNGKKNVYWCCSTWIKKGRTQCSGISVPDTVTDTWEVKEESTVLVTEDDFGRKHYSLVPKTEYEKRKDCPYQPKKRTAKYSHSTYPLSGKLYCSKCGSLMHHQGGWNHKEFWWCGRRVKQGPEACEGVRVPATVADMWEFEGCVYVTEGEDEDGKKCYGYQSKSEDDGNGCEG